MLEERERATAEQARAAAVAAGAGLPDRREWPSLRQHAEHGLRGADQAREELVARIEASPATPEAVSAARERQACLAAELATVNQALSDRGYREQVAADDQRQREDRPEPAAEPEPEPER